MEPRRPQAKPAAVRGMAPVSEAERARWATAAQGEKLIALGMIMGSQGLQGLMRVKPYNADSDTLTTSPLLIVRGKAGTHVHAVQSVRPADKGMFMQLVDVTSVEHSKTLHGSELCVPRSVLPALEGGAYYHADLEGLQAISASGAAVGVVQRVIEYPAASVLSVEVATGVIEVPMREPYLVSVDVSAGRVVVDHVEDLDVQAPRSKAE